MSGGSRQFVVVGSLRVFVTKGDITQQQVDVIVNSSRSDLDLSRGRASKALLDAAGADIQDECEKDYPYGIQDGEIAITSGGLLSCGAIYHGALSKYSSPDDEQNLENIIQSSLDQAETDGYVTIAFPALGAGFLGYPPGRVAEILFSCIQQVTPQSLKEVRIVIFPTDNDNFKVFLREAKKYSGPRTRTAALRVPQDCIKIGNVNVKVMVGELSNVKAGVIVCSGPSDLQLSNNGLSQSLSDVAGPQMQEELNQKYPNGIDYGTFAVSGGYNLKCRFVYHGALPKWTTNDPDPSDTMEDFVDRCLETANQHSTKTIAFPTLGVGSLSYPIEQSAKIMGECIRYFCTCTFQITIQTIIIVVYKGCRNYSDIQKEFIKELNGGPSLVAGGLSVLGATVVAPSQNIVSRQSYSRKFGNMTVTLLVGDMAEQQVDVIVNSIASDLTMSSGVAAAISAAAGPGLSDELEQNFPMGIKEGDIATTQGHDLQCNEVYNGYLSPWFSRRSTGAQPPDLVLGDFVFACLERANTSGYSSIAFPALGTGYHKFPVDAAAESMVASIFKFSSQRSQQTITDVRIVLYGGSSNLSTLEKEFKHEISQGNCSGIITPLIQSVRLGMTPVPSRGTKKYIQYRCGETIRSPPNWTKFTSKKTLKEWIQAANSGKIHFEEVDQTTRASIEKAFGNTLGNTLGNAQIVNIQRIENADLFLRYGEERQRLFRKVNSEGQFNPPERIQSSCGPVKVMGYLHPSMTNHTESEINEYYFFHATKPHLVDIICKQGLDPRIARVKGRLGTGVYGAEDACKSHQYADSDYRQCFPMFLVRMSLGDIYMTQADNDDLKRPPCKVCSTNVCINHQEIYDSVMANGGSFKHREFVIYDRHQSYPEYLIWYKA